MLSESRRRKLHDQRDNLQREFKSLLADRMRLLTLVDFSRSECQRAGARLDLYCVTQQTADYIRKFDRIDRESPQPREFRERRDDDVDEAAFA